jgi:hypothetical protein
MAAALLGVLAVAGLAACRADPTVAAYVDDVRITEAEVDQAAAERGQALAVESDAALAELELQLGERVGSDDGFTAEDAAEQLAQAREQEGERLGEQAGSTRDNVVTMRILTEVAASYAEAAGLEVPAPDYPLIANEFQMSPDSAYVRIAAEFFAARSALASSLEPAAPTEADQREMYDNLIAQGVTGTFEEAQQVLTVEQVGGAVALRNLIVAEVEAADLQVNPRYAPIYQVLVPLGNLQSWLTVPLADSAVTDSAVTEGRS